MAKDLDQIKVHLPKELKAKFAAKAKKENKTQTAILRTAVIKYINE